MSCIRKASVLSNDQDDDKSSDSNFEHSCSDFESQDTDNDLDTKSPQRIVEMSEKKDISILFRYDKDGLIIYDSHARMSSG